MIEIAGPHVEVVRPAPGATFLVCTNRYRTPTLQAGELAASAAWAHPLRAPRAPAARAGRGSARAADARDARAVPRRSHRSRRAGPRGNRARAPARRDPRAGDQRPLRGRHAGGAARARRRRSRAVLRGSAGPSSHGRGTARSAAGSSGGDPRAPGFTARVRDDFVGAARRRDHRGVHEAARAYEGSHDAAATLRRARARGRRGSRRSVVAPDRRVARARGCAPDGAGADPRPRRPRDRDRVVSTRSAPAVGGARRT